MKWNSFIWVVLIVTGVSLPLGLLVLSVALSDPTDPFQALVIRSGLIFIILTIGKTVVFEHPWKQQ